MGIENAGCLLKDEGIATNEHCCKRRRNGSKMPHLPYDEIIYRHSGIYGVFQGVNIQDWQTGIPRYEFGIGKLFQHLDEDFPRGMPLALVYASPGLTVFTT